MTTGRRCKRQRAHWPDQVSLKDRATFLEDQKMLREPWTADMAALIEGQNAALQQVVMQTVALLRAQGASRGDGSTRAACWSTGPSTGWAG